MECKLFNIDKRNSDLVVRSPKIRFTTPLVKKRVSLNDYTDNSKVMTPDDRDDDRDSLFKESLITKLVPGDNSNRLSYHQERYQQSWADLNTELNDFDEINRITEYFKSHKLSIIKMNHEIDPNNEAEDTQYHGYM